MDEERENMSLEDKLYKTIRGTGDIDVIEKYRIINFKIDKYVISIKVSDQNKFIDIDEIKINEDFRDYKQKFSSGTIRFIDNYEPE